MDKICLELENVEVSFLDRQIFEIPRLAVHQFDRIGIVGKNGAGKSTLLKLMAGTVQPDQGQVRCFADFAYFDQLAAPVSEDADYELMAKLAIPKNNYEHLSGGEQTRLKLAQLFTTYHEGLLIDEPTTHLDATGVQFFIEELTYYYGALVLVSHDRHLLDQLVTKIWEIDDGQITEYSGNYSSYVEQKTLQRQQQQEQHEKYIKEKERLLRAAQQKQSKARKVAQGGASVAKRESPDRLAASKAKGTSQKALQRAAKAIEHRVEQMGAVEAPTGEHSVHFHQAEALALHNKFPIMAEDLTLRAGDKVLLKDASFQFPLGETIAITGENGVGKTTLFRHIQEQGEGLTISPKAAIGVYEQRGYQFNEERSVLDYMRHVSDYKESKIRSVLHAMDFTGNAIRKNVRDLSGGEAIRLTLCQLFLGRYNILLLDEPTNFLDVYCIEALESFLQGYEGTVLFVSHDHRLIERVADQVYAIEEQQLNLVE